jgi:hypothetical protein
MPMPFSPDYAIFAAFIFFAAIDAIDLVAFAMAFIFRHCRFSPRQLPPLPADISILFSPFDIDAITLLRLLPRHY